MSQYKIVAGTGQHIGDRHEQQDRAALFTAPRAPGYMMAVVADGMGGVSGGAMAAEQVMRTARQAFDQFSPRTDSIESMLTAIAADAHTTIKLTAIAAEKQPHSTMVALVITPAGQAHWAHVGDSRLYLFREGGCLHRTVDHSYVEQLVAKGRLPSTEAHKHRLANVLLGALGDKSVQPRITLGRQEALKPGDVFLLCTDGLWHDFADDELGAAVAAQAPRQAAERLIHLARERAAGTAGDNCTLAIVKLMATQDQAMPASAPACASRPA